MIFKVKAIISLRLDITRHNKIKYNIGVIFYDINILGSRLFNTFGNTSFNFIQITILI